MPETEFARVAFCVAVVCLGLPAYAYVGYPVILFLAASVSQTCRDAFYILSRRDRRSKAKRLPSVSIIIAAHNEESVIEKTLSNCLELRYPSERLEIVLGSDGSTDRTVEIAKEFEKRGVRVIAFTARRGKLAVIRDCAEQARGEVLVFSDANTLLHRDAIHHLVRHFRDPVIGAVCGELRFVTPEGMLRNEGLYWRYETALKILESRMDSVLGANGAIYAVRKELFPSLPPGIITDDFVVPMKVRSRGFRVIYDPEALAMEESPSTVKDEFRRRMRIGAGNWQALWHCRALLLPWKGFVSFAFWSHKVARWFTPFLLLLGLAANLLLMSNMVWRGVLAAQLAFYAAAALGSALRRSGLPIGPLRLAFYFVVINAALAVGLVRGLLGAQSGTWQRTAREPLRATGRR